MDRIALLEWVAAELGVKHGEGRNWVSKRERGIELAVDANADGTIRVHLVTAKPEQLSEFKIWADQRDAGPIPALARPSFRQGDTHGARHYFEFEWVHRSGADYASERGPISAFLTWLRGRAGLSGVTERSQRSDVEVLVDAIAGRECEAEEPLDVEDAEFSFDLRTVQDDRERVASEIIRRRGQAVFRERLLERYGHCLMTGCRLHAVLEAAHIVPYQGSTTNHVENGLLLRADLHTLFDLEYLAVDPSTLTIAVSPQMSGTEYAALDGQRLHLHDRARGPSRDALAYRFARFQRSLTR